ncbi:MAG TPA: GntR family transcriptional regulator [Anaerolineales bacterium]|nr:GntR family transcriptional regulator [Anaerolineales bacterium]
MQELPAIEARCPIFSKGEYAYHLLKEKIANGYLERNKIYTIVEMAESLGISRTPVGEAVKILASQNYIILNQGVGFKVRELSRDDIRENLMISGALEVVELKKIIHDGTKTVEELERAVEKSWNAIEDQTPELYTRSSAEFHKAFYALAALPRLTEILYENVFVHEIWYREAVNSLPEGIKSLIVDHENIINVIRHADLDRVEAVINRHVENCEEVLLKVIQV